MAKKASRSRPSRVFSGVAASPGIAVGPLRRLDDLNPNVEQHSVTARQAAAETRRFLGALTAARAELEELRDATRQDLGESEARIFDVQLMVLQDPMVVDRTVEAIRAEHLNAEFLFCRHAHEIAERLESISDSYFSDRAVDLHDIKRRVLRHLSGGVRSLDSDRAGILLGREIAPSDAVSLDPDRTLGFATELGGVTSHAAIMARARGIPAVVGVRHLNESAADGDIVAVDGIAGRVYLNPGPEVLRRLRNRRRAFNRLQLRRRKMAEGPAETRDGHRVILASNMELPQEMSFIRERGAQGIGLFRTEFFFMVSRRAPSEDEQYETYAHVVRGVAPEEVVVRVLDVGGDKVASYLGVLRERNPYLGMRGIRYLLAHPEVLETQLRAILRAGAHGKVKILFPMVSSVSEFRAARAHTEAALESLRQRRIPHERDPELGVMIEVPSAVMMADELAREADFFSIGSNDLIQYTLAVDRDHEVLHHLYQPLHPAILRALRYTVKAGHAHDRWVSICGEMAGDPWAVPLIVGLGMDRFSVSPSLLPEVKQTIRTLRYDECRLLAMDALKCVDTEDVKALVRERLGSRYSALLSLAQDPNGVSPDGKGVPRTGAGEGGRSPS